MTVATASPLATVEQGIAAIARGEMVIVIDDPNRENEGDLVMAAEHVTPAAINFMATHGRGLICVPMTSARLNELQIPPMTTSVDVYGTAFHVSVDHAVKCSTGISASDRATTIRAMTDPGSTMADFSRPGHVFPLAYREGGVLRRPGHTEASIDLAVLAGLKPAAVICEIADEDGSMARLPRLLELARQHGLLVLTISDLVTYRRRHETLIERLAEARMPLAQGTFTAIGYRDVLDDVDHLALVLDDVVDRPGVLVHMHSECLASDVFGSRRCGCGEQLDRALDVIGRAGRGVVVYLRGQQGHGLGLLDEFHAYQLQDHGLDTVDADPALGHNTDCRDYGTGMQILRELGIREMRLLTDNPTERHTLESSGLSIINCVPLVTHSNPQNVRELEAKRRPMGHLADAGPLRSAPPSPIAECVGW